MSKRKKITLAVIASLVLHLFLFLAVVGYYTIFPPPANPKGAEDQDTPQLTILDTPPDKEQQPYVRTEDDQKTDQKQDNAPFQSDKDTAAASEKQSNEQAPLPTQDGKSLESLMFRNNDFSLAMNGQDYSRDSANGGENAPSTPGPPPHTTPTPAPTAKDDDLAMLRPTPTPLPTPNQNNAKNSQNRPGAPRTAYRPQSFTSPSQGKIGKCGRSSVWPL